MKKLLVILLSFVCLGAYSQSFYSVQPEGAGTITDSLVEYIFTDTLYDTNYVYTYDEDSTIIDSTLDITEYTLSMTKCTDLGLAEQEGDAMFLGQNIPNPANAQTVVNYQVPTDGTVVFTLTTVTGQVIYTTTQEVAAGRNSVEFNTENLAAGIYFYTMDFNGQRLTKKMTIRK